MFDIFGLGGGRMGRGGAWVRVELIFLKSVMNYFVIGAVKMSHRS